MENKLKNKEGVSQEIYSEKYFSSICDGGKDFGKKLPARMEKALSYASIQKNEMVLDLGCGRGEILNDCQRKKIDSIGIDFALPALKMAKKLNKQLNVAKADLKELPIRSDSVDVIIFLETIEHLHDWEVKKLLKEMNRVLKKGGRIIISTAPNKWLAKPLYAAARLMGVKRGINEQVHVNEQSVWSLKKYLKQNGFRARVWLEGEPAWFQAAVAGKRIEKKMQLIIRLMEKPLMRKLVDKTPLQFFLAPHVWAIGHKE